MVDKPAPVYLKKAEDHGKSFESVPGETRLKRHLSGNNDPGARAEARPGCTGLVRLTSISVHVRMLDQIIDERTRNSVFSVSVKTISMFSENLSVTHGE